MYVGFPLNIIQTAFVSASEMDRDAVSCQITVLGPLASPWRVSQPRPLAYIS